ncbi:hypothetical protein AAFF_G00342710 [Aldrovandia affinis]|uniref:Uncharacterized protein n=1 Tax=Aldrovandia affinis TaxID=143900 RepID=A0AAD7VZU0_9TELE|nr:hypothetical protein AAFF_G00342710 [Aldrovandia affinis]
MRPRRSNSGAEWSRRAGIRTRSRPNALREQQLAQLEKSVEQEKAQNQELQAVQEKALRGESEKHGQQLKELRDQLEKSVEQEKAQNQELQTEQEKLLAQREDVSSQLQEVNRANSRLLEQLTERGQEKDKLQQELEETWKTADKRKAMLDELAIDVAQEKLRHKEELQAQIQSMEGTKGWFERRLKEAEETAEKSALEHQEQCLLLTRLNRDGERCGCRIEYNSGRSTLKPFQANLFTIFRHIENTERETRDCYLRRMQAD